MKKQNRIAFLNMLSTLLLRGLSIVTSAIFSRLLGTNGYGVLSTYNVWVSVAAITGTLQTSGTLVNAENKMKNSSLFFASENNFLASVSLIRLNSTKW